MKLKDMIAMAFGNLFKRKIRTLLTVSGVVIGTCAIVVMISFGIGIRQSMEEMMKDMGDLTVITINSSARSSNAQALDEKTLEKIKKFEHVVAITPVYNLDYGAATVKSGKYDYQGSIYGVSMSALKNFGYQVEKGQLPPEGADETTILFGKDAAYDFIDSKKNNNNMVYPNPDKNGKMPDPYVDPMTDKLQITVNIPEGSSANVKPIKLKCTGTLVEDWGKNPAPSHCIFMDITFAKKLEERYRKLNNVKDDGGNKNGYNRASVKVESVSDVAAVEQQIKDLGFDTYSMESVRKPLEEQMRTIQMILGGLGAISLLVAALGITNTMIMSIYERTREIGIMKVLGCLVPNIRTMFLMEAGAIGFMGGTAGIIFSYTISFIINTLAAAQNQKGGHAMGGLFASGSTISVIPVWLALGALVFATMVGLFSGLQPARRAVRISALTAIKQD